MTIRLKCAACQRNLKVPDEALGKKVQCPVCGARFVGRIEPPPPAAASPLASFPNIELDAPPMEAVAADGEALDPVVLDAEEPVVVEDGAAIEVVDEAVIEVVDEAVVEVEKPVEGGKAKPEKKKSKRKILLGCLAGVLGMGLLVCGGAGVVGYRFLNGSISDGDWKTFAPPGAQCSVSMPGEPVTAVEPKAGVQLFRYTVVKAWAHSDFLLLYYDLPFAAGGASLLDAMIEEETTNLQNKLSATTVSKRSIALEKHQGREAVLDVAGGRKAIVRFYLMSQGGRTRVFELVASGPKMDANDGAGGKFFNSFAIFPVHPGQPGIGVNPRPTLNPNPRPGINPKKK